MRTVSTQRGLGYHCHGYEICKTSLRRSVHIDEALYIFHPSTHLLIHSSLHTLHRCWL